MSSHRSVARDSGATDAVAIVAGWLASAAAGGRALAATDSPLRACVGGLVRAEALAIRFSLAALRAAGFSEGCVVGSDSETTGALSVVGASTNSASVAAASDVTLSAAGGALA